jgi:excisionase family DNA binding protein
MRDDDQIRTIQAALLVGYLDRHPERARELVDAINRVCGAADQPSTQDERNNPQEATAVETEMPRPANAIGQTQELYTAEQTGELLGVGRTTVFALLNSGALRSVRIGRLRRVPATAIREYITTLETES